MSYKLVQLTLDANLGLRSAEKFVLLCLAERANERDLIAWPSIQDIVIRTGYSKRCVLNVLIELEEKRLIEVVRQNGRNNSYFLAGLLIHNGEPSSLVSELSTGELGSKSGERGSIAGELGSKTGERGSHEPEEPEINQKNQSARERHPEKKTGANVGHQSFKTFTPQKLNRADARIVGGELKSIKTILAGVAK